MEVKRQWRKKMGIKQIMDLINNKIKRKKICRKMMGFERVVKIKGQTKKKDGLWVSNEIKRKKIWRKKKGF